MVDRFRSILRGKTMSYMGGIDSERDTTPVKAMKGFLFVLMTRDSHLVYTLFLIIQVKILNIN